MFSTIIHSSQECQLTQGWGDFSDWIIFVSKTCSPQLYTRHKTCDTIIYSSQDSSQEWLRWVSASPRVGWLEIVSHMSAPGQLIGGWGVKGRPDVSHSGGGGGSWLDLDGKPDVAISPNPFFTLACSYSCLVWTCLDVADIWGGITSQICAWDQHSSVGMGKSDV